ncbi:MAG: NAD(P)/FAD-dependent oxidoreductase [Rhodobacteraceae bacterium]|nr:MAG: NAD(P)/FAD-dependent oxidoreductase [Paracoccaceae bacterium]
MLESRGLTRRDMLAGAAALSLFLAAPPAARAVSPVASRARIVIVGAGAAGLSCAARLKREVVGAEITLIDPRKRHYYQPGFTLVAAGLQPADYVLSSTAEWVPDGVAWIEEAAAEIDPDGRKVVTASGRSVPYDFLIVAAGLTLDFDAVEGFERRLIGRDGVGAVYAGPEEAAATAAEMMRFAERGGVGVFGRPATEMKCAGAPLKYTMIVDDILRTNGTREQSEIKYFAHANALFSVPIVNEKLRMLFDRKGVEVHRSHVLKGIDPVKKLAFFTTPDGTAECDYDFINVIPPMRAPEPVRNSPLPWREGPWANDGWVEVDRHTMRHLRYPEVFAVGDVAGVPKGKTAASVKWQVPVAVDHLVADIAGRESLESYNGYTSCPLITRIGRAMLIEFDYDDNLVPSFPGVVAPLEELWISWLMKKVALKPTYFAMIRGQA